MPPQSNYKFKWWDDDGNPLVGGLVYTYVCGTTTDKATYTSATMQTENANPVVLDSNGEAIIYLAGPTKFVVKDSDGNSLDEQDYVGVNVQDVYDVSIYGTWGSQAAVEAAIADMGADYGVLYFGAGTWTISSDLTIASYITVRMEPGAKFYVANTKTLIINGPIEAGPYEIFTWAGTGTVDISGSPTVDVPIEWFGGVTGVSEDCATAFAKVDDCIGPHQNVRLGPGVYRIATAVVWPYAGHREYGYPGFGFMGTNLNGEMSCVMIDTTGAIGMTFGAASTVCSGWRIKDINFIGEATCATNMVLFERLNYSEVRNVNFVGGSTDYACVIKGAENTYWDLRFGLHTGYIDTLITKGQMANNLKIMASVGGGTWANNTWNDMTVLMSGSDLGAYGIYMDTVYNNFKIRGDIENVTDWAIYMTGCSGINLENIHIESTGNAVDAQSGGIYVTGCSNISFKQLKPMGETTDENPDRGYPDCTVIRNSHSITIDDCKIGELVIYPDVYNITARNLQIAEPHGLVDMSGNLAVIGGIRDRDSQTFYASGKNCLNIIKNSLLNRWTASVPDGWTADAHTTWTKTGTGEVDTTRHTATYAAELVSTEFAGGNRYDFSAEELRILAGNWATGAVWFMCPETQTFVASTETSYFMIDARGPVWVEATDYRVGDAVYEESSNFVCVTAGTSGAALDEPTWSGVAFNAEVEDNGIVWVRCYSSGQSKTSTPINTDQSDNLWRKLTSSVYVPRNVSTGKIYFYLYEQSTDADSTFYIAEPTVHIGMQSSRGFQQGKDEHESCVYIGGNKLSWGTAAPGAGTGWHADGDLHINTAPVSLGVIGWQCTTAGEAAAAAWTNLYQTLPVTQGTFTCANNTDTTVTNAVVTATSTVLLMPTNDAAGTLMGAATSLVVSARNAGVSFVVSTANGGAAGGTETFSYVIIG